LVRKNINGAIVKAKVPIITAFLYPYLSAKKPEGNSTKN
jgi:hypothetical protein